jgi:hypothetical protein
VEPVVFFINASPTWKASCLPASIGGRGPSLLANGPHANLPRVLESIIPACTCKGFQRDDQEIHAWTITDVPSGRCMQQSSSAVSNSQTFWPRSVVRFRVSLRRFSACLFFCFLFFFEVLTHCALFSRVIICLPLVVKTA